MNKKQILAILGIIAGIIILIAIYYIMKGISNVYSVNEEIKTIGQLSTELDNFKEMKNDCRKNATYFDVLEKGRENVCSDRDTNIEELRKEIGELSTKKYEQVLGLK